MDKKKLAKFFADTISKRELTEEQTCTLQQMLFPGLDDDPNKRLSESALDMATAYMKWDAKQSNRKDEHHAAPMTDAEIEELAAML